MIRAVEMIVLVELLKQRQPAKQIAKVKKDKKSEALMRLNRRCKKCMFTTGMLCASPVDVGTTRS